LEKVRWFKLTPQKAKVGSPYMNWNLWRSKAI